MSHENVELTRRVFDAFVRRDRDAFVAFHDPDCEIQPLLAAVGGNYHGHDGVREWWEDLFGAFPDFSSASMRFASLATGPSAPRASARMGRTAWTAPRP